MSHEPLTARRVADALGRHVVAGVYGGDSPDDPDDGCEPELHLRLRMPDGNPAVLMFDAGWPRLRDGGLTVAALGRGGSPSTLGAAMAIARRHGVGVGPGEPPELFRRLDAAEPAEDAMALVLCVAAVLALAEGTPRPTGGGGAGRSSAARRQGR